MKTTLLLSAIIFIAFIFSGCEKSDNVFQEDYNSTLKKKPVEKQERPFKSSGTTYATGGGEQCTTNDDESGSTFEYAGEGKATHMGNITLTGLHCVDGGGCADGSLTFVAANGDELYNYYTNLCIIFDDPNYEPPFLLIEGWATFEGGTGRFEDATGSIFWVLVLDTSNGTSTWEANGTIIY